MIFMSVSALCFVFTLLTLCSKFYVCFSQWFSKNSQSLVKMLDKRAILESLRIDGVDTRELMMRLHRLLKGTAPSVDDIVYVRKYIHIAIAYLRKRSQLASGKAASPAGQNGSVASAAPSVPPQVQEPVDITESIRLLATLSEKYGSATALWSSVKDELKSRTVISKGSVVYSIGSTLVLIFL